MQFPQTTYLDNPAVGFEGGLVDADAAYRGLVGRAEVAIRFGLAMVRGTAADDYAVATAALCAPAADADGWVTAAGSGALADSAIVLEAGDWDGVQGNTPLKVGRKGAIVLNNHADWDATSDIELEYIDDNGNEVWETFDVSDLGNETFTTREFMVKPIRMRIADGSGVNRTITFGWTTELGNLHVLGVALRDRSIAQPATPVGYPIGSAVTCVKKGQLYVLVEDDVIEGNTAFVRLTAGGGETAGRFRSDTDGGDACAVPGIKYAASGSAATLVPIDINV